MIIAKYFFANLLGKWYNIVGIISSLFTQFIAWFADMGAVGSLVSIVIAGGVGWYSILQARHKYKHKKRMDNLEYQKKIKELNNSK